MIKKVLYCDVCGNRTKKRYYPKCLYLIFILFALHSLIKFILNGKKEDEFVLCKPCMTSFKIWLKNRKNK